MIDEKLENFNLNCIFSIIMSALERQALQYQVSLNSFKDEVGHKKMLVDKIQSQFCSKVKAKTTFNHHNACEVVKYCRKNIQQVQRIFVDVHSYFIELNLQFAYELFLGLFKIMIITYRSLSEKFINLLKDKKKENSYAPQNSYDKTSQRLLQQLRNKSINQIQYFDNIIKSIESDEKKLMEKKKMVQKNINFERQSVQNVHPSDAVNQLEALKKHLDRIIVYAERLGDDNCVMRSQQYYKSVKLLKRPEEIQDQYCNNIAESTKEKFINKMQTLAKKFYSSIRQNQKNELINEINLQKPPLVDRQTQTAEPDARTKMENIKDKNTLIMENDQLRKANMSLKKQLHQLGSEMEKMEQQRQQLQKKIKIASEMLNKKNSELQKAKVDYDYNMNKKDELIQVLNKKIVEIKSERTNNDWAALSYAEVINADKTAQEGQFTGEEGLNEESLSSTKFRTISKDKLHHTSFFYQRQFKIQKKQNSHLRKSLLVLLDTLKDQKLILQYPINEINNDLRLGKLIDKIQAISILLLSKVKQIKSKQPEKRPPRKKTSILVEEDKNKKIQVLQFFKHAFTQTPQIVKINNQISNQNHHYSRRKEQVSERKTDDKLQMLKKQLFNRLSTGKKVPQNGRSRLFLHQIDGIKQQNNSIQNIKNYLQQAHQNKKEKRKINFNRKDISFEEFKFNLNQNKSPYGQKKILHRVKKSSDNLLVAKDRNRRANKSYENDTLCMEIQQPSQQNQQFFSIQGYQTVNDLKFILQTIDRSGQQKQYHIRQFVSKLVDELRKAKGKQYIEQLMEEGKKYAQMINHSPSTPLMQDLSRQQF